MKPQDYSARTEYRPPASWYRRLNWLGVLLASAGLAPRDAVTLQETGGPLGAAVLGSLLSSAYQSGLNLAALPGSVAGTVKGSVFAGWRSSAGSAVLLDSARAAFTTERTSP
jgi:hypothetical protein